jgi:hypothetical protein
MSDTWPGFRKTVDLRWLEVFDSLYCGDPRPADIPCMNFWRSKDIYSDHMVFQYHFNGVPLHRIDNSSFMIGTTGTCYYRAKQSWKGMLILSAARGGRMNTYYGNMDLLDQKDGYCLPWCKGCYTAFSGAGDNPVRGDTRERPPLRLPGRKGRWLPENSCKSFPGSYEDFFSAGELVQYAFFLLTRVSSLFCNPEG